MGTELSWFVCFEAQNAPTGEVVERALASVPLVKVDASSENDWAIRVGRADCAIGLSRERHVVAESGEMAESASDASLSALLERADARFEILFDAKDAHWFGAAIEHAAVRLAALSDGVVCTSEATFRRAISNRPTTLKGERLAALEQAVRERFPDVPRDRVTIEDVVQPFFGLSTIVDVTCHREMANDRVFMVVDDDAHVLVLTGMPESFAALTAIEPAATLLVASAVQLYVLNASFWTQPPGLPPRLVRSIDDVPFRTYIQPDEQARIDAARRNHGAAIGPVRAEREGEGWRVTYWLTDEDQLVRRDVHVGPAGQLDECDTVVCSGLPLNPHDFGGFEVV